jgi:glycosyltransferase involved in cell wall biosynthesis
MKSLPEPAVSIIIPTFNRSTLVLNAIDSVLNQTFRDFELIVIDDGSTDDTCEKLQPYSEAIRYHRQENRGVSSAQNKGVELARGRWISILGSDDVWLPTKLERQMEAVAQLGCMFGACFTDCTLEGDPRYRESAFRIAGLNCRTKFAPLEEPFGWILGPNDVIKMQSLIVLRSIFLELQGFDEQMVVSEDTDLIFRMAFLTKFCFVNEPLVRIDRTPNRKVGLMELVQRRDERMFRSRELMFKKWLSLPNEIDVKTRRRILDLRQDQNYSWLVMKIYRLNVAGSVNAIRRLREGGAKLSQICRTIAFRAARRTFKLLSRSEQKTL